MTNISFTINRSDLVEAIVHSGYDEPEDIAIHCSNWVNVAATLGVEVSVVPPLRKIYPDNFGKNADQKHQ